MGVVGVGAGRHAAKRRSALLILCGGNLALLAAIAGNLGAVFDIVAPLTGHIVGVGVAASLALLTRRLSVLVLGMLMTLLVHAWLGLASPPCCQPAHGAAVRTTSLTSAAASTAGQALSLLTLNAWHGHRDPARLMAYLANLDADLVVLSEFGPNKRAMLARLKPSHPYQVDCAQRWACALALLSRVPFEAAGTARIADGNLAFVWARLGGVTVIGTHLYRPSRDPWLHERQMRALIAFLDRIPGPVILAGDLNTTPWSKAYRSLRRVTGLVPASTLRPTWPAWPLALPQVALDHIFVSRDLTVTAAGTGPAVGSDHLPIWAIIERPPSFDRARTTARSLALGPAPALRHLGAQFLADLGSEQGGARNLCR